MRSRVYKPKDIKPKGVTALVFVDRSREKVPPSWKTKSLCELCILAYGQEGLLEPHRAYIINLTFLGLAAMARMNGKFRGEHRATDILSFELPGPHPAAPAPRVLGDLVLCPQVLRHQAKQWGHGVRDELVVLIVHGLAHLLGYDHEQGPRQAARQKAVERRVLKRIYEIMLKKKQCMPGLVERLKKLKHQKTRGKGIVWLS